jgi:hypothetical protein
VRILIFLVVIWCCGSKQRIEQRILIQIALFFTIIFFFLQFLLYLIDSNVSLRCYWLMHLIVDVFSVHSYFPLSIRLAM